MELMRLMVKEQRNRTHKMYLDRRSKMLVKMGKENYWGSNTGIETIFGVHEDTK